MVGSLKKSQLPPLTDGGEATERATVIVSVR